MDILIDGRRAVEAKFGAGVSPAVALLVLFELSAVVTEKKKHLLINSAF